MATSNRLVHISYSRLKNKISNIYSSFVDSLFLNTYFKATDWPENEVPLVILWAPPLATYNVTFLHDKILSSALTQRGHKIIPMICDQAQEKECNIAGDMWLTSGSFEKACNNCFKKEKKLWEDNPNVVMLSEYINENDKNKVSSLLQSKKGENSFLVDDIDFNLLAKEIVTNNSLVENERYIINYEERLNNQIKNLLTIYYAYKKIILDKKPDRVISNDSHYGMWRILQSICKVNHIPFYSNYPSTEIGAWCYEKDRSAMNLDFERYFKKIKNFSFTHEKEALVLNWLSTRNSGSGMYFNTSSIKTKDLQSLTTRLNNRPTATLFLNVSWDLAALNKQIVFYDQFELIKETIRWFEKNPQYCLIIKSHPAERSKLIPKTTQDLNSVLKTINYTERDNIITLFPEADVSSYDLINISDLGIVHTSTIAIEMAEKGKPVITTARSHYRNFGITIDSDNKEDYFKMIENVLTKKEKFIPNHDLVMRFFYFYFYEYFIRTNIINSRIDRQPRINRKKTLFKEGSNFYKILRSIELGEEIHQYWLS